MPDPDPDDTCSFCGKARRDVGKLLRPSEKTRLAGPVAICNECIEFCNQILADDGKDLYFEMVVDWTQLEVDGLDLEWSADRSLLNDQPVLMLHVRHAGQNGGFAAVHPADTIPTEALARSAARIWLDSRKK